MERIVKLFFSWHQGLNDAGGKDTTRDPVPAFSQCIQKLSSVAKLWDEYLTEVSFEAKLSPVKFADLIERVPTYARVTHDNVYKAIHSYLKVKLQSYSIIPFWHYVSTVHTFLFLALHYKPRFNRHVSCVWHADSSVLLLCEISGVINLYTVSTLVRFFQLHCKQLYISRKKGVFLTWPVWHALI